MLKKCLTKCILGGGGGGWGGNSFVRGDGNYGKGNVGGDGGCGSDGGGVGMVVKVTVGVAEATVVGVFYFSLC